MSRLEMNAEPSMEEILASIRKIIAEEPPGSRAGRRTDQSPVSDKGLKLAAGTYVVQVGKRKFARVTLS